MKIAKNSPTLLHQLGGLYLVLLIGFGIALTVSMVLHGRELMGMPAWTSGVWLGTLIPTVMMQMNAKERRFTFVGSHILPLVAVALIGMQISPGDSLLVAAPLTPVSPKDFMAPFGWFAFVVSPFCGLGIALNDWHQSWKAARK